MMEFVFFAKKEDDAMNLLIVVGKNNFLTNAKFFTTKNRFNYKVDIDIDLETN